MSKETEHHYPQLDFRTKQIRLIRILGTDTTGRFQCRSELWSLNTGFVYTALSYAWGSPSPQHEILLDDQSFFIRENLWSFFSHILEAEDQAFANTFFWIDAISIDQSNYAERNHQVALMADIYRQARYVLAWLGPASDGSDTLFQASQNNIKNAMNLLLLPKLCERPYWTRLWIFQEVLLARELILLCGCKSLAWDQFSQLIDWTVKAVSNSDAHHHTYANTQVQQSAAKAIAQQRDRRTLARSNGTHQTLELYELMCATRALQCHELRDRAFGLLGVAGISAKMLVPDYNISLPELAHTILRQSHSVRIPKDAGEVVEQCSRLAQMLGVRLESIMAYDESRASALNPRLFRDPQLWFGRAAWALAHGHYSIVGLLIQVSVLDYLRQYVRINADVIDWTLEVLSTHAASICTSDIQNVDGLGELSSLSEQQHCHFILQQILGMSEVYVKVRDELIGNTYLRSRSTSPGEWLSMISQRLPDRRLQPMPLSTLR